MLGSSKRTVFKPTAYGSSRRKRRIPRWFVLLLTGIALGAGGLLFFIVIKTIAGKWREIPIGLWVLAVPLVYYFATLVKH